MNKDGSSQKEKTSKAADAGYSVELISLRSEDTRAGTTSVTEEEKNKKQFPSEKKCPLSTAFTLPHSECDFIPLGLGFLQLPPQWNTTPTFKKLLFLPFKNCSL